MLQAILIAGTFANAGTPGASLATNDIFAVRGIRLGAGAAHMGCEAARTRMPTTLRCDVCVVGGGSGGIGAALAASRAGVDVILVERESRLGGTSTVGGVSVWERGPGCSFAREIYERLATRPCAVTCVDYDKTLTRRFASSMPFDPDAYHAVVSEMLAETSRCRILLETTFVAAIVDPRGKRVESVRIVSDAGRVYEIGANVFVDCTGDGVLCQAAGCETMLGADPKCRFNEPDAPSAPGKVLNALEQIYRIKKNPSPVPQPLPEGVKNRWRKHRVSCCITQNPTGGVARINPCGLVPGWTLMEKGYDATQEEAKRQAQAHWHALQAQCPGYTFDEFALRLAVRETYRIVGEYVLTERDVTTPYARSPHADLIAYTDHPMDTHGASGGLRHAAVPYGIPYRCLVPKGGWKNLLIACRGASFSHIAASSCRLQRTMIQLGHAAGLAAAQCVSNRCGVSEIDVAAIQRQLGLPPCMQPRTLRLIGTLDGFDAPSCVCADTKTGYAYVANALDPETGRSGYISRLSPKGKTDTLRWIESTPDAPFHSLRSLCIRDGILYGTESDRVVRYALDTRKALPPIKIPDARGLTGLTVSARSATASDALSGRLYHIANGQVRHFASPGVELAALTDVEGCLYAVCPNKRDAMMLHPCDGWQPRAFGLPTVLHDPSGIDMLNDGCFIVADRETGRILQIGADRKTVRILAEVSSPDGVCLDWPRKRLFVPSRSNNCVWIYEIRLAFETTKQEQG